MDNFHAASMSYFTYFLKQYALSLIHILLGLITFLTAGVQEVHAWTITNGTKAPAAGGKIHSDIERGFIRAEIVSYDDLIAAGSQNAAREKGQVRLCLLYTSNFKKILC